MLTKKQKIVVAMSGGVDSSVAAALLVQQGYEVIGISLKVWDYEDAVTTRAKTCCSYRDIEDARDVCSLLGIPFYAFNFKKEFKERVIDPFVAEYARGYTPNPCILCNNHVKFDLLLAEAQKLGADYLATGHHARIKRDENGICHLIKGIDASKDQSYVLFNLTQENLKKIQLPVGDYTKSEVRDLAKKFGIATAMKPESQDICFIPNRDHAQFIEKNYPHLASKPGNFVDKSGAVLGKHRGIHGYTVGQRRGLGVGSGDRLYVTKIDVTKNEIVLGDKADLSYGGLIARQINWIQAQHPKDLMVKVRYQKNEIKALVEDEDDQVKVLFKEAGPTVSPGQAAVFYLDDEVVGGGTIDRSLAWEI